MKCHNLFNLEILKIIKSIELWIRYQIIFFSIWNRMKLETLSNILINFMVMLKI